MVVARIGDVEVGSLVKVALSNSKFVVSIKSPSYISPSESDTSLSSDGEGEGEGEREREGKGSIGCPHCVVPLA